MWAKDASMEADGYFKRMYELWTHWDQDKMDDISQTTFWNVFFFLNENAWILIKMLLKFAPKGPTNKIPA